jgi:cathepsin B
MYKLAVIGTVAATTLANTKVNQDMVNHIRSSNALWTPMEVSENPFANYSDDQLKGLLGTVLSHDNTVPQIEAAAASTSFDSRTKWPGCVHAIRDQAQCGSCWAFAASEALSDRFCIASGKKVDVVLSPQDMVSCDKQNYGCDGGYLNLAWSYLEKTGVGSDACEPYTSASGSVAKCSKKCKNGSAIKKYKCKAGSVKSAKGPAAIKTLIEASGPVETGFTVYDDFFNYKSGIYHHVSGGVDGGHAVKIIGWGAQGSENYWIVANSWGTSWGEKGFFNIRQGDSGIDDQVFGCTPDVAGAALEAFF